MRRKGKRSAERRIQPMAALQTVYAVLRKPAARVRQRALSGRARLPALHGGSRRNITSRLNLGPCLLRRGRDWLNAVAPCRSAVAAPHAPVVVPEGMMPEAARERIADPRAGAASRSTSRIASGMRPLQSRMTCHIRNGDSCQGLSLIWRQTVQWTERIMGSGRFCRHCFSIPKARGLGEPLPAQSARRSADELPFAAKAR
jgi:hypothetical protein